MMNQVGLFYTYWSTEWKVDFPAVAQHIAGLGFDIMEVNLAEFTGLSRGEKLEFKKLADDLGLQLTCLTGLGAEHDLSSEDGSIRSAGIEYVKRLLDDSGLLGSPVFGGLNFCAWPAAPPPGVEDKRPYLERAAESVREVLPAADANGVTYVIEVVNRFEQWLVNDTAEGLAFCDMVGSPNCQLHLDTFHMNIEEDSFRDAIRKAGSRLGHFHIGEANRKEPGRGRMPWDEIFGSLKEVGYTGPIVMEPFVRRGGAVGRNVALWRDLSDKATDEEMDARARESLQFVCGKLR
ncbi:MAG: sugar phosphate isomerase/epimerase [Spirochaetaceae bacterium]|nr:sugar phosphate isomerase/epimerase [Spirochaetaceae bacterium]MCF7938670.1 sugar phosphate isomerase/epimerase [Spirochaetales bacterium]